MCIKGQTSMLQMLWFVVDTPSGGRTTRASGGPGEPLYRKGMQLWYKATSAPCGYDAASIRHSLCLYCRIVDMAAIGGSAGMICAPSCILHAGLYLDSLYT